MQKHYPQTPWCRYADDGLVHYRSEIEAKEMLVELEQRFNGCGLVVIRLKLKSFTVKMGVAKGNM
jgi:RNA-directed DNA polymerase